MARRFLTPLRLLARSTNPASGAAGDVYYNSSDSKIYVHDGAQWTLAAAQGVQGTIGGGLWTSSATAPVSPAVGDRWFDTTTGLEYTWLYDGDSYQWVDTRTSGYVGPQGIQGTLGTQGAQGIAGYQGSDGAQGSQGTQGSIGSQGTQGTQGFDGAQGSQGIQGIQGTQGVLGTQGATGTFGGETFEYNYLTNVSETDPGSGNVKFDTTTFSAVTELYISTTDFDSTDISSYLETIDDSTSSVKGTIKVTSITNELNYGFFHIIGAHTLNTSWYSVPVAYVSGSLSLANNDNVYMTFARVGDKGDTGLQGSQGTQGFNGTQGTQGTKGDTGSQGTQGTKGDTGSQGTQGTKGDTGSQGTQGTQGTLGSQGTQGTQGTVGSQGTQGTQGTLGSQGTQGTQGVQGSANTAIASSLTSSSAISNTETNVASITLDPNTLSTGTTYLVLGYGARTAGTNTANATFNIRIGTTTSATAGNIASAHNMVVTNTAAPVNFSYKALITVRSTGSTGTVLGTAETIWNNTTGLQTNTTATVTVDTTTTNYLKFTFNSGNASNTYTFYVASITEVV